MVHNTFSQDWLKQFTDPFAVLGVSVAADDRRVLKRYRNVAKLLHPDSFAVGDAEKREQATQMLARLVNPSYQRLKQDSGRSEAMAMLRFRVRRISKEEPLQGTSELTRKLINTPTADIEVFYEQAIAELAQHQFQDLQKFADITQEIGQLNLIYLRLKMGEPIIREKRTGLVAANDARPIQFTPVPTDASPSTTSYAQRHYQRAQEYMKVANWSMAVQELRDAIKIESDKSNYHSLLARAYMEQNLPGMAKVHFRQALKLNPQDPLALKYAPKFNITVDQPPSQNGKTPSHHQNGKASKPSGGLFGLFARRR
jgi:curved DNA-binding protein CbpA